MLKVIGVVGDDQTACLKAEYAQWAAEVHSHSQSYRQHLTGEPTQTISKRNTKQRTSKQQPNFMKFTQKVNNSFIKT